MRRCDCFCHCPASQMGLLVQRTPGHCIGVDEFFRGHRMERLRMGVASHGIDAKAPTIHFNSRSGHLQCGWRSHLGAAQPPFDRCGTFWSRPPAHCFGGSLCLAFISPQPKSSSELRTVMPACCCVQLRCICDLRSRMVEPPLILKPAGPDVARHVYRSHREVN